MKVKHFYLAMSITGLLVSLKYMIGFINSPSMGFGALATFLKDDLGLYCLLNIIIATTVLSFYIIKDAARIKVKNPMIYVFWSFLLGLGSGLPAYLYARENRKEAIKHKKALSFMVEDAE